MSSHHAPTSFRPVPWLLVATVVAAGCADNSSPGIPPSPDGGAVLADGAPAAVDGTIASPDGGPTIAPCDAATTAIEWQDLRQARVEGGAVLIDVGDAPQFIAGATSDRSILASDTGIVSFELGDSTNHHFVGLGGAVTEASDLAFAIKLEEGSLVLHRFGERGADLGSAAIGARLDLVVSRSEITVVLTEGSECTTLTTGPRPSGRLAAHVRAAPRWNGDIRVSGRMDVVTGPRAPVGDCGRVTDHFGVAELELYRARAAGATAHDYVAAGDVQQGSPGEWTRIGQMAESFMSGASSAYDGWNGPPNGPSGYVERNYTVDPIRYFDDVMNASFYALVTDSDAHRTRAAAAILEQTDVSRYPGVDFSNRDRWRTRAEVPGIQAHMQNPFFFTADFVKKVLHAYEYTAVRVVDGEVVDSGVYSAAEREQIEGWLWNAGDYFRRAVDNFIEDVYFDSREARVRGDHKSSLTADPGWTSARLWDGGPRAHNGHLQWQNRITDEATLIATVGVLLDDEEMMLSARLFFQEVIRYAMQPDGLMGDLYRCAAFGIHYTQGQLTHLIEIADLFARNVDPSTGRRLAEGTCGGDTSLYDYETSEGITMDGDPGSSTVGGPKSLLRGLLAMARFYRPADNPGLRCGGELLDGIAMGDYAAYGWNGRPEMQHYWTWGQAVLYYEDDALESFVYGDRSAGYRGWSEDVNRVANNGYVIPSTRGTFSTSVGKLFLYGHTHMADYAIQPFGER